MSLSLNRTLIQTSALKNKSFYVPVVLVVRALHSNSVSVSVVAPLCLPVPACCRCSGAVRNTPSSRRIWSAQEDEAIRQLVQKHGTSGWTLIADKLAQEYKYNQGRSGKQCWERWHNHLGGPAWGTQTHREIHSPFEEVGRALCLVLFKIEPAVTAVCRWLTSSCRLHM